MDNSGESLGVIFNKKDYAGLVRRVVIAVVDLFVIFVISAAILYISDFFIYDEDFYQKFNFILILLFSIWYLALLKRSKLRTIGYILTNVKIVDLKGEKPSIFKMVLRVLLLLLGPFELIIDIIWLTQEATKQTLRDKYVGTYVVNQKATPIGKAMLQTVNLGFMGWHLMYREVKETLIK